MPAIKNSKTHCINGHLLAETGKINNLGNRYCGECRRLCQNKLRQTKEWKDKNRGKYNGYIRDYICKRDYGISFDDALKMFDEQKGKCKICGDDMHKGKRGFCVDHDHKTGKVRGILCNHCNSGLGMFKDNTKSLENAIKYLKEN